MSACNYDSYCGIYCGACDIHVAYQAKRKSRFAAFFTERTLTALLASRGVAYRESDLVLKCHGCKSDTVFINCSDCPIRSCAVARKVEHCIDCGDYPCAVLQNRKKMEGLLPHLKTNRNNMTTIRKMGLNQWLNGQREAWQCPKCRERFAWYTRRCDACGADLKDRSFEFSRMKAALLKAAIHVSAFMKIKSGPK